MIAVLVSVFGVALYVAIGVVFVRAFLGKDMAKADAFRVGLAVAFWPLFTAFLIGEVVLVTLGAIAGAEK